MPYGCSCTTSSSEAITTTTTTTITSTSTSTSITTTTTINATAASSSTSSSSTCSSACRSHPCKGCGYAAQPIPLRPRKRAAHSAHAPQGALPHGPPGGRVRVLGRRGPAHHGTHKGARCGAVLLCAAGAHPGACRRGGRSARFCAHACVCACVRVCMRA